MTAEFSSNSASQVAVIAIGRNEGERLLRCLRSIPAELHRIYVDSGSNDGSEVAAAEAGAEVVRLDPAIPFTAARARNAGLARLAVQGRSEPFVQMIDGDCELHPHWLGAALAELQHDPLLAGVFGRRRERHPERSPYNWLCDVEWSVPAGPAMGFGGDVMLRRSAVETTRYPEDMIAGEDTELSIRLRQEGWTIRCIPAEMTLHDAALFSFSQWQRRMLRSGHAIAEISARHPRSALHDYDRRCLGIVVWGLGWPIAFVLALVVAALADGQLWDWAAVTMLLLGPLQVLRVGLREWRTRSLRAAFTLSLFRLLGKFPEALGVLRFWRNRLSDRRSQLIEYKDAPQARVDEAV